LAEMMVNKNNKMQIMLSKSSI